MVCVRCVSGFKLSHLVFVQNEDSHESEDDLILDQIEADEAYSGLRAQDLQEAKDQLLVETSDMLRVPLFTAEALLRNHGRWIHLLAELKKVGLNTAVDM